MLNADYSVQESGSQIFRDGSGMNLGSGFHVSDPRLQFSREVDYCSAAAVMVKRTFWLYVSGFDERFAPAYFEDTDLCFAAWENSLNVLVAKNAYVIHQRSSSYGQANRKLMEINRDKFNLKWAHVLQKHWENKGEGRFESSRSSKGIVILVDNLLPSFSRDSGSIRTIKLLSAISDLGYHVCLAALSKEITPLDSLKLSDLGVEVYPNVNSLIAGLENRKNRVLHFWLIREEAIHTYFDVLLKEFPNAGSVTDLLDLDYSSTKLNLEISSSHQNIVRKSNCTVLVSPHERSVLEKAFRDKVIFDVWKDFEWNESNIEFENRSGLIFIGGFGHTPNREGIYWFVESVLPYLKSAGFNHQISLVGTQVSRTDKAFLESQGLTVLGNLKSLQEVYNKSLISICPLLSGRGMKGKIAEALSFGLPVVTTNIGIEGFGEVNRECVRVADEGSQFAAEIVKLSRDSEYWTKLHKLSEVYVKNNFSNIEFKEKIKLVLAASQKTEKRQFNSIDKPLMYLTSFKIDHMFRRQSMIIVKPNLEIGEMKFKKPRFKRRKVTKFRRFTYANCQVGFGLNPGISNVKNDTNNQSTVLAGMLVPPEIQGIYGHWLVDILPKFFILQKFYGPDLLIVLEKPVDSFVKDLLQAIHISPLKLKVLSDLENQRIKLVDTSNIRDFDYFDINTITNLFSNVTIPDLDIDVHDKLFISRSRIDKHGINSRLLTNRSEVEDFFAGRDFRIIHPESLDILQQLYLFSNAEIVAGEAGSGLHNSIYMKPGKVLINLQSDRQNHFIQSTLGSLNNLRTLYVWGKSSTEDWNSNFVVSIDNLEELFKEL